MPILEERFTGVKPGQIWLRKKPRSSTSPHVLTLAIGDLHRLAAIAVKCRLYNADTEDMVGYVTIYPLLENMEKRYEYLGVLKPQPVVGMKLPRADGDGHFLVTGVTRTHCQLVDWDKRGRRQIGTKVHHFSLGPTFWNHVEVFWPKRPKAI